MCSGVLIHFGLGEWGCRSVDWLARLSSIFHWQQSFCISELACEELDDFINLLK